MANDLSAAAMDQAIRGFMRRELNSPSRTWRFKAAHLQLGAWRNTERRINALAREARNGWYLMHSMQASFEGRQVMWLHFATEQ